MNKIFSHKVTFQIISVVVVILLANSFMQNRNLNRYVYESVDRDLSGAIGELEHMNEAIFGIYMQANFEKDYRIDMEHIYSLSSYDREIEKIFNLSKGTFQWYELEHIECNITDIKKRGHLTKADEEYLKSIHKYNKRLITVYYGILKENKIDKDSGNWDYRKIKMVYEKFMAEANKMGMEQEYKRVSRYEVQKKETETVENNHKKENSNISLKEAEQLAMEVLEKLFHKKTLLSEEKNLEQAEYEFENNWKDGEEKNLYNISIDKEKGSFRMYKRSQFITSAFSQENLDKKAREIKDILVPKNYVCYERKKKFHEGKLEEIAYKFIKKINNVYDESHIIEVEINSYGELSDLYISDPLGNNKVNIEEPKFTKEDIISKLSRGKVNHVILVKDTEGQLQYRIFVDFNEEVYIYNFDANTGEKRDFRKSDKMYFKRVNKDS